MGQSASQRPVLIPPPTQAGTPAQGHDPTLQVYTGHREWLREARPFLCVPGGGPGSCPEHCWLRAPAMCPPPCAGQRFGSESRPPVSLTPSRAVPCTQQVLHNCTVTSDGNVCVTSLWSPQEATEVGWHAHPWLMRPVHPRVPGNHGHEVWHDGPKPQLWGGGQSHP